MLCRGASAHYVSVLDGRVVVDVSPQIAQT